MTQQWRFKDEWLLPALTGLGDLIKPFIARLRAEKAPYLSHSMLKAGLLTEATLGKLAAMELKVKFLQLTPASIDHNGLALLQEPLCRKFRAVPVGSAGAEVLIATDSPLDFEALAALEAATGLTVIPYYCLPLALEACLDAISHHVRHGRRLHAPADGAGDTALAALISSVIAQALRLGAAELRLSFTEKHLAVRLRTAGELRPLVSLNRESGVRLIDRLKTLAHLNVSDRRKPQTGLAKLRIGAREVWLQVTTHQGARGEEATLRLLDRKSALAAAAQPPAQPKPEPKPHVQPKPEHRPAPAPRPQVHHKPAPAPAQPAKPHPQPKPEQRARPAAAPPAPPARKLPPPGAIRVMVAEDNEMLSSLLTRLIEDAGFFPVTAADGLEALELIAGGLAPDLLITDLHMPRMSGMELVKAVRQSPAFARLPVLILTTDNTDESQELAFKCGADDYIAKPFSAAVLSARIRAALRRAGKHAPPR